MRDMERKREYDRERARSRVARGLCAICGAMAFGAWRCPSCETKHHGDPHVRMARIAEQIAEIDEQLAELDAV
jgi:rubrerythrin